MTAKPPSLSAWSKNKSNLCTADEIPLYWKTHDVITVLADTGMYDASMYRGLDPAEKERVRQFTSEYFKKRFIVSRSLLKSILGSLMQSKNREDIVLTAEKKGIGVHGRPDIFLSLSYSGSCIALSLAKRKIGSDIEMVRSEKVRKVQSSPLFTSMGNKKEESISALHVWTMVEAYAKLRDKNPFPLLAKTSLVPAAGFVSYSIDRQAVLSLAWDPGPVKDTLLWIDPVSWKEHSSYEKTASGTSPLTHGGTYART